MEEIDTPLCFVLCLPAYLYHFIADLLNMLTVYSQ